MADFKLKLYMPGPLGQQMIFVESAVPYFSGYISNGKNRIKVTSPFGQTGKNGMYNLFIQEGKVTDEDIDTIFKSE